METLIRTIEHLHNEKPINSERVIILVCPPLTRRRFEKEKHQTGSRGGLFSKKRTKEFADIQDTMYGGWNNYESKVIRPLIHTILCIKNQSLARIIFNATFRNFKKAVTSKKFEVIFLLAHHINKKNEPLQIEFADGGYTHKEIYDLLSSLAYDQNVSLLFFVCKSGDFKEDIYGKIDPVKGVAASYWPMPTVESIEFIKDWIFSIDGKNTLSQAYDSAIEKYIKQFT